MKFHTRDFSLEDAPWLGKPVEVDSDQIETLIVSIIPHDYTTWEIADIHKISKSIVISENEKCIFYFMGKTIQTWPTQYFL